MTNSIMNEPGFIPSEEHRSAPSLIPGTYRFANLPNAQMKDTACFKVSMPEGEYSCRQAFNTVQRFDQFSGKFIEHTSSSKGWEVVYPNGRVCSHIFDNEKNAFNFIKEVKNVRSSR